MPQKLLHDYPFAFILAGILSIHFILIKSPLIIFSVLIFALSIFRIKIMIISVILVFIALLIHHNQAKPKNFDQDSDFNGKVISVKQQSRFSNAIVKSESGRTVFLYIPKKYNIENS